MLGCHTTRSGKGGGALGAGARLCCQVPPRTHVPLQVPALPKCPGTRAHTCPPCTTNRADAPGPTWELVLMLM